MSISDRLRKTGKKLETGLNKADVKISEGLVKLDRGMVKLDKGLAKTDKLIGGFEDQFDEAVDDAFGANKKKKQPRGLFS